jgi:hypothetical protein
MLVGKYLLDLLDGWARRLTQTAIEEILRWFTKKCNMFDYEFIVQRFP